MRKKHAGNKWTEERKALKPKERKTYEKGRDRIKESKCNDICVILFYRSTKNNKKVKMIHIGTF